jgi:hypothetical protein
MDDQLKMAQYRVFVSLEIKVSEVFYIDCNYKMLASFIKIIESLESAANAVEMNCNMHAALESVLLLCLKYLSEVGYDECKVSGNRSDVA